MFLAVAAMVLTGCKGGGSGPDLAAMGKAMSEAKSYRMTTVASGSEVSMEIECPNKVHTTSKTAGNTSEMVAIDTAMYMKDHILHRIGQLSSTDKDQRRNRHLLRLEQSTSPSAADVKPYRYKNCRS